MGWVRAALLWGLLAGAVHGVDRNLTLTEHEELVRYFRCGAPQPRTFSAHSLLKASTAEKVWPNVMVLHRCYDSGSCGPRHVCTPDSSHRVTLWFNVSDTVDHRWQYASYDATNHTHCHCSLARDEG